MRVFVQAAIGLAVTSLTGFATRSGAEPVNLQEQERISLPAPYGGAHAPDVCLLGNDLLALAVRALPNPEPVGFISALVHLKKQADGEWRLVRELAAVENNDPENFWSDPDLDCEGPLAAFSNPSGASYVVELTSAGWQATRLAGLDGGSHADVYRGTVAIAGQWRSPTTVALVRKNAAGQWADVTYAVGNPGGRPSFPEIFGPANVSIAATEIAATGNEYESPEGEFVEWDMQIFDLIDGSWRLTSTLDQCCLTGTVIDDRVALKLDEGTEPGDVGSYFVRDAVGAWTVQHLLLSDEPMSPREALFLGQRVFASVHNATVAVFLQETPRRYRHWATLSPSSIPDRAFGWRFSVDGNRVATADSSGNIYLFQLPATLPEPFRLERTFESNSTAGWSFSGTTDWRIASSGHSHVFRQLRTDASARAVLDAFDGTEQSIQADVRIMELVGTTSWAGFLLRYTDLQNYYYLRINRNSVQIRKIVGGVFQPVATAPLSLVLGRVYRFRIEAIGTRLRAFVNGVQVLEAIDDTHASGRVGLSMFRARTNYDNVIVTSRPQTLLYADTFSQTPSAWTSAPANAWNIVTYSSGERVYRQSLLTGTPRAVNGAPTGDQIVQAIVRPRAFNAGVNGWIGVMARHVDDLNHYYVALYRDRAALRKRVNGVHSTIREVPFTAALGVPYRLRLEAFGPSLRFYVNDTLMAEGQDATLPSGRYGLITFNATADFDNFRVIRP
jgi:hypothetical protein